MKRERLYRIMKHMAAICLVGGIYAVWIGRTGIGIPCPIRLITGWKCPGCGITHMCISLLHLDFSAAFLSNPAVFCLLPVYILLGIKKTWQYIMTGQYMFGRLENIVLVISIAILILFGIARNLFLIY